MSGAGPINTKIEPRPEVHAASIVLLGDLNPKIFQPAWFAQQGLIRQSEGEGANIEIVHPDVVVFSLDWVRVEVTRERFSARSEQPDSFVLMRDLVFGAFSLLNHTPIRAVGFNQEINFQAPSEESWHKLGHRLAPKDLWLDVLKDPGLRALTMVGARQDDYQGYTQVRVAPTKRIAKWGIEFGVNDHFDMAPSSSGCSETTELVHNHWHISMENSAHILARLRSEVH